MRCKSFAILFVVFVLNSQNIYGQIFSEDFNNTFYLSEGAGGQPGNGIETDCDHPLPNCGIQAATELDVFGWGWVEGWEASGRHAAHAVDLNTFGDFGNEPNFAIQFFNGIPVDPPAGNDNVALNPAVMIWHNNVITLANGIADSNISGQTYSFDFVASPAVYQAPSQVTTIDDGLLIEVLRPNDTILASHEHLPGDWAGDVDFVPDSFEYVGDGSGDVRLRIGPSNFGSGHFGGAIDELKLSGTVELFNDGFDGFTAPAGNFNGLQFESGLPVAHSGDAPNWDKEGGGTIHMVDREPVPLPSAADPAVMIWHNNVISLETGIPGSNDAGVNCTFDFVASPAVYQAPGQVTTSEDGLLIELLRDDDTVMASHTHMPGDWAGDLELVTDSFEYEGDGSGDIRVRIGPSNFSSGHFGGAIDDLKLTCGAAEVFSDGFDGFTAPPANFNGFQFESGLPVAHSGDLPDWSEEGGGTVHMVDRVAVDQPEPEVLSDTNTLLLVEGIDANDAGSTYEFSARIGPSVWAGASQATTEDDYVKIELLREDDTVLVSFDAQPEPWEQGVPEAQDLDQDGMLDTPVSFEYTGDGSGPVRIQISGAVGGTRRFGGSIDDIVISRGSLTGDYNQSGALDVRDIDLLTAAIGSDDLTFDANGDGSVTAEDRTTWVEQLANTWFGDSNLDGQFNSSDLVAVFQAGKYEVDEFASWGQGDWDGNQRFGTGDLVAAFQGGGFEAGPRNAVATVPEPSAVFLLGMGLLCVFRRTRNRTGIQRR